MLQLLKSTLLRLLLGTILGFGSVTCAQDLWVEPQDSVAALLDADRYAWRLFVALNWPADIAKREADPTRTFGEHAVTVWESWKLTSGVNDEVFLAGGINPGPWLPGGTTPPRKLHEFESLPFQQLRAQIVRGRAARALFDPEVSTTSNENHMNKAAYDFVVENELYNVEGQELFFEKAEKLFLDASAAGRVVDFAEYRVDFPPAAKEVKAQWRLITEADKDRYHWAEFENLGGDKQVFGLTALHITTKDLPNWLWATFEHVDNPNFEGAEHWILPSRDSAAGVEGYPAGLGIEGTRWQHYRLRGTQTEFVNAAGEATLLANSQIEQGFQTSSSCITCHARAAIGSNVGRPANRLSIFQNEFESVVIGNIGSPVESWFIQKTSSNPVTGELKYLPLDFVWSFRRAKRKAPIQTQETVPGFAADIVPLFRQKDINSMKRIFDLSKYEDVKDHAREILNRLEDGSMPCDGPWPDEDVNLFRRWVDGGMPR